MNCIHVFLCPCVLVWWYTCIIVSMYACMIVYMYTCVLVYMYTHGYKTVTFWLQNGYNFGITKRLQFGDNLVTKSYKMVTNANTRRPSK